MMKMAVLKRHRLAKWDIAIATTDDLLAALDAWRYDAHPHLVCFCDANGLAHGWREPEVSAAYRAADAVMADGIVVKTLVRLTGGRLPMRVCGPAFFERALAYGVSRGWRHYFCGGAPVSHRHSNPGWRRASPASGSSASTVRRSRTIRPCRREWTRISSGLRSAVRNRKSGRRGI